MSMKHTEFMRLTQGTKSLTEYLHAFNNLARYATKFVDTDAKKIASFKRGLSPKLMKMLANSNCATFNEFISDALTQQNQNNIYSASKRRKRAYEACASRTKALVAARPQYRPPTSVIRYKPPQKKVGQAKIRFHKAFLLPCPKALPDREAQVFRRATCPARTATSLVIGQGIALIPRRITIRGREIQTLVRVRFTTPT
jgi:hypothetical protein